MLDEITPIELVEWMQYAALEPFDEERADLRAASICSTVTNNNANRKRGSKHWQPKDFVLTFGDSKKTTGTQSWQAQKEIGKMFAGVGESSRPKRTLKPGRPRGRS